MIIHTRCICKDFLRRNNAANRSIWRRTLAGCAIALLFAIVVSPVQVRAEAFGFTEGQSISTVKDAQGIGPFTYKTTSAPRPHSAFEFYIIRSHPTTGICSVQGVGKDIETNGFGLQMKSAEDDLAKLISNKYGSSKKTDALMPGSIWKETSEWTMGVLKKDRMYAYQWEKKYGSKLPSDIDSIALISKMGRSDRGWLVLEYNFSNYPKCAAAIDASQSDAF